MGEKPKNILVVTDSVYPQLTANSGIAYRITEALHTTYGCRVTMLAVEPGSESYTPEACGEIVPELVNDFSQIYHLKENSKNSLAFFLSLAKKPELLHYYLDKRLASKMDYDEWEYPIRKAYERAIRRLLKQQHFDCIFCLIQPSAIAKALVNVKPGVPCIVYKLDPWATNPVLAMTQTEAARKEEALYEQKFDAMCAHILTTNLIFEDMRKLGAPVEKYRIVEFPNIVRPVKKNPRIAFDKDHIHCVYTGVFYTDIRNPGYVLAAFEKLQDTNILFHIFGLPKALPEILPNNVIFHGQVSQEDASDYTLEADILVNVGNAVSNMVPSKLLSYISTGKPILNFTKIDNCPTLPHMKKYPLGLTVRETEAPNQRALDTIREFILSNKGKCIPFEEIEKLYYEGTPAHMSKQLYALMENATVGNTE